MTENLNSPNNPENHAVKGEIIIPESENDIVSTAPDERRIVPFYKKPKVLRGSLLIVSAIVLALALWGVGALIVNGTQAAAVPTATPTTIVQAPLEAIPVFTTDNEEEGLVRLPEVITTPVSTEVVVENRTDFEHYTVVEGDTIFGIAENFGLKPESVLWTNWYILGEMPDAIYPGTDVLIPPEDGAMYMWYEGDGLNGVARGLGVTPEVIVNYPLNDLNPDALGDWSLPNIAPGTMLFVPGGVRPNQSWVPARGEVISGNSYLGPGACSGILYGNIGTGTFTWPTTAHYLSGYDWNPPVHNGLDFDGDFGSPIYAADSGVIIYSGWSDRGYGNLIVIDHDGGWQTYYGHLLDNTLLPCGSNVIKGELIASMGSTGNSTGPHLHFELRSNGIPVNPWQYLQ
ncbi:MAG: peptidoglycan DD-metalloendopeptidase family protein [Anaerolineaceae bacterium]|nr:peptidoglycan DD-metalloendopeptidase family protein [Anaerolineaceae bacterium]